MLKRKLFDSAFSPSFPAILARDRWRGRILQTVEFIFYSFPGCSQRNFGESFGTQARLALSPGDNQAYRLSIIEGAKSLGFPDIYSYQQQSNPMNSVPAAKSKAFSSVTISNKRFRRLSFGRRPALIANIFVRSAKRID